ncbi:IclR family transcriptional regulator [Pseudomaricurvus sp.]|uniref:IclR family transcriptional regulator n=1 Tax=Pseudomaricurvus sp. TaxID=2004510 RepID=UPI003F6AE032
MLDIPGLPRNKGEETDRKFIEALARGLDVLRAFLPGDGFLGNQEIAQRTGLPKSSVSRLTYTLTQLGYLTYSERMEKYQLGSGVLALGYAFVSNLAIRQIAKPMMQELANNTGTSVGLADRDRLKMIYVEYCSPTNVMAFRHEVGDRVPLPTGSAGRAYLAALSDEEREFFFNHIEKKQPDEWPTIKSGILDSLQNYREKGFCHSYGDWDPDVNGISVPLTLGKNTIYCFNAGGPAYRLSRDFLENEVAPQLKNMVRNIEATLIRY